MFGIIRPCRTRLGPELAEAWLAHLCGLCLALRDDHGQLARVVTNYDGLAISAMVEAQSPVGTGRRAAGPCPLRGMKTANVAQGGGARLAATVSLVLASAMFAGGALGDVRYSSTPRRCPLGSVLLFASRSKYSILGGWMCATGAASCVCIPLSCRVQPSADIATFG